MTAMGLKFIADKLNEIGVPYCFEEWTREISYPYFIGEYTESEPLNEDGQRECSFILTGTTNGSRLSLEQVKHKIRKAFPDTAITEILPGNMAIAIMYAGAMPVATGVENLKRIQINLKIKEWSVV